MRKHIFLSLIAAIGFAACSSVEPPETPPTDVTSYPPLADDGYASTTIVADYPMMLPELRSWLADGNKIVALMESTENIAKPADTVYFTGEWPEAGATRRVELEDGHFVLERVLSNTPERFEYQIWAMTNAAGKNVDHIHGIQAFEQLPNGNTQLSWTYKVRPNAGFKRPLVQRFVNKEITPFLTMAVDNTVALAEESVGQ